MKLAIASDHAGYELKNQLIQYLENQGHIVQNFGTNSTDSCDYPDYAHPAALSVESQENEFGILICGSGQGVAITANKHQKIRCALAWMVDIAQLSRQHNNANMIALPARFITSELAFQIVDTFLTTEFEGGRHQARVDKIPVS